MRYFILLLIVLATGIFVFQKSKATLKENKTSEVIPVTTPFAKDRVKIIAQNLDTPWSIIFLPNGNILVTERLGKLSEIDINTGEKLVGIPLSQAREIGEGGLLGLTLDPEFANNNFIYLYYTYEGDDKQTLNRVSRFVYKDKKLSDEKIIVNEIPGAPNHNGGRIKFGPDKNLYVTTGDAGEPSKSQDLGSLAGKILKVAGDNVEIYSYGHRNPQGLVWDLTNQLWVTEHGRSGVQSGFDELNKVDQGKNYGWPEIQGDETNDGMESPVAHSGATTTWAPAGVTYIDGNLYFGGLRGSALYKYDINSKKLTEYFKNEFGRIRDVVIGPDKMLYITTSNKDGRGTAKDGDDKIIRIDIKPL